MQIRSHLLLIHFIVANLALTIHPKDEKLRMTLTQTIDSFKDLSLLLTLPPKKIGDRCSI